MFITWQNFKQVKVKPSKETHLVALVTGTVNQSCHTCIHEGDLNSSLLIACPHIPSSSVEFTHTTRYRNHCSRWTELRSEELGSRSCSKARTELKRECRRPCIQLTRSRRGRPPPLLFCMLWHTNNLLFYCR